MLKQSLFTLLMVTAIWAVKPIYNENYLLEANCDAISSIVPNGADTISYKEYFVREDGLLDSTYNRNYEPSTGEVSNIYTSKYTYDFDNLSYIININYESFLGKRIINYDENGVNISDSFWLRPDSLSNWDLNRILEYRHNNNNQITEIINYTISDSDTSDIYNQKFYYSQNGLIDSSVYTATKGENAKSWIGDKSVVTPSYIDNMVVSSKYEFYLNGFATPTITNYNLNTTSIKPNIYQYKKHISNVVVSSNGKIFNINQTKNIKASLYLLNGKSFGKISINSNNVISNWKALKAGYYILKIEENGIIRSTKFRKK